MNFRWIETSRGAKVRVFEEGEGTPVLFLHGAYDYTCETIDSRLAEPMRHDCADLTEVIVFSGHWMAQERPIEVNAALAKWLAVKVTNAWPNPDALGRL